MKIFKNYKKTISVTKKYKDVLVIRLILNCIAQK